MKQTNNNNSNNTTNNNNNRERAIELVRAAGSDRTACVQTLLTAGFTCLEEGHDVTVYLNGEKVSRLAALRRAAGVQAAREVTGGGASVAKVNFAPSIERLIEKLYAKLADDFSDDEREEYYRVANNVLCESKLLQGLFDQVNERVAERVKAAAKLRRDTENGIKAAARLDNDTLLQVLIAKGIDEQQARALLAC